MRWSTLWPKLKAVAVVEGVALLMALVAPILPGRTGAPYQLPASLESYVGSVLLCFAIVNGILAVLLGAYWGYRIAAGRPSSTKEDGSPPDA